MRAYYAHCVALYNTPQEARDLNTIKKLGFDVVNPNAPEIEARCDELKRFGRGDMVMELVFRPLVTKNIDAFIFRANPDGRIPSGVALELGYAHEAGIPLIELPSNIMARMMTLTETREYLEEVGNR